jgi:hypothetical protein
MKLISTASILVKIGKFWVGFNEYGNYVGIDPYTQLTEKDKASMIKRAKERVKQLGRVLVESPDE